MLAATCDKNRINFHWSDNSGMVRTGSCFVTVTDDGKDLRNEETINTWQMICSYVYTLYFPKDNLVFCDDTMSPVEKGNQRKIQTSREDYVGTPIHTTQHHSRQTCVFDSELPVKRAIKDIWQDEARRHHEHKLLEKAKGTPGVVQVEYSEEVPAYKVNPETQIGRAHV